MALLFILTMIIVPLTIGGAVSCFFPGKGKNAGWGESYVLGVLFCILTGEAVHLGALFTGQPFHIFSAVYGIALGVGFLTALIFSGIRFAKKKKNPFCKFRKPERTEGLWMLLTGILILSQCVFHIFLHTADMTYDIVPETVSTMLSSDTIYEINPMTGSAYRSGMPMRLKILALPGIYAAFCRWFRLSPQLVVHEIVPVFVLILNYTVLAEWGRYFYPEKKKQRILFLLIAALLLQFGNYAAETASYGLFHMGYRGEVFCLCVLYPYLLLKCLKREKRAVVLCLIAEAGLVWTLYGLGAGVLICATVGLSSLIVKMTDGRRKTA